MSDDKPKHKPQKKHTLSEVLKSLQDLIRTDLVTTKADEPSPTSPKPTTPPTASAPPPSPTEPDSFNAALEKLDDIITHNIIEPVERSREIPPEPLLPEEMIEIDWDEGVTPTPIDPPEENTKSSEISLEQTVETETIELEAKEPNSPDAREQEPTFEAPSDTTITLEVAEPEAIEPEIVAPPAPVPVDEPPIEAKLAEPEAAPETPSAISEHPNNVVELEVIEMKSTPPTIHAESVETIELSDTTESAPQPEEVPEPQPEPVAFGPQKTFDFIERHEELNTAPAPMPEPPPTPPPSSEPIAEVLPEPELEIADDVPITITIEAPTPEPELEPESPAPVIAADDSPVIELPAEVRSEDSQEHADEIPTLTVEFEDTLAAASEYLAEETPSPLDLPAAEETEITLTAKDEPGVSTAVPEKNPEVAEPKPIVNVLPTKPYDYLPSAGKEDAPKKSPEASVASPAQPVDSNPAETTASKKQEPVKQEQKPTGAPPPVAGTTPAPKPAPAKPKPRPKPPAAAKAPTAPAAPEKKPEPAAPVQEEIPILKEVAELNAPNSSPLPTPGQARDIAIRVIAKLNIERRKTGETPLDIKTIEKLQQYLTDALAKRALNKPK